MFRPNWSADAAAVVLERDRVSLASALARAAGVTGNMRRGSVLMLLPQAILHERDAAREQRALHEAALALLQYTPQVSSNGADVLLLDIGASLTLFGGIRALCRRVRGTIAQLGLSASLGCAPTAAGAALLAQQPRARHARALSLRTLLPRLERLPIALLGSAVSHLDLLDGIGCRDLADLRRLPRAALQRRCGAAVLAQLDQAWGLSPELHEWIVAPPDFQARIELPDRIEHAQSLQHAAQGLLAQMSGWLSAHHLAVGQVTLQLQHERGRQAIAPTAITLTLAQAVWQETHLLRLLQERLASTVLCAPVIAVSLQVARLEAMAAISTSLFPEPGGTPQQHARLLELLSARLGPDNVRQAKPLADHRPEVSNHWQAALGTQSGSTATPLPDCLPPRPAWLLPQPLPLEIRQHRPYYRGTLQLASPPERIETGWWQGQLMTRDYHVAVSAGHVYYWIYRERIGDPEQHATHWYLHGLFG